MYEVLWANAGFPQPSRSTPTEPTGTDAGCRANPRQRLQGNAFEEETVHAGDQCAWRADSVAGAVDQRSKVLMQHNGTKQEQECHVVFLGPVRSGKAEIGLEFSVPSPTFWRVAFPPEDWTPKHPEARSTPTPAKK